MDNNDWDGSQSTDPEMEENKEVLCAGFLLCILVLLLELQNRIDIRTPAMYAAEKISFSVPNVEDSRSGMTRHWSWEVSEHQAEPQR